jgi:hypothetical protein
MYGTAREPEIVPSRTKGHYAPCTYKGEWVRYDVKGKPLGTKERRKGIGQVVGAWVYDALIVDIDSAQHGRVSAFLYEDSKYRRDTIATQDRLWRVEEPLVLREGIGL